MRRVIYCEDDSYMDQAVVLAKQNNLPINVGYFDEIKKCTLSDDKVQILEIPEENNLFYYPSVRKNFHQNIVYVNDFIKFNNFLLLSINDVLYKPILVEKHKAIYNIYETSIGVKNCKIDYNDQILESFEYNVY